MADPYRYFRVEAREILDQLQQQLLELERGTAAPDAVKGMLRLAHTLKGAARVVKQRELGELSHSLEDQLVTLRDEPATDATSITPRGLELLDAMEARLAALDAPPQAAEPEPPPANTTKPVGEGTGLGLSITYSIVKKHGGTLELTSGEKGGTVAEIRLPLSQSVPPRGRRS